MRRQSKWPLAVALALTVVVWSGLYIQRASAHSPNVDDYLYARIASNFGHLLLSSPLSGIRAVLHSGQTAPLVPVLASVGEHIGGVQGAVGVEWLFLILLVSGVFVLARMWLGPVPSTAVALAAGINQAVLGWSLMLNFSVAATAATVWTFASYLRSDRLRNRGWAVATGAAGGLLLLSRSVAPVYAAPLAALIGVDLLWHHRARSAQLPLRGLALAIGIALLIAGPWWLVSWHTAFHYLHNAGYQASSGFAGAGGARLSTTALSNRARWTLNDLGHFQSDALLVALALSSVILAKRRQLPTGFWLIAAWVVATFLLLSTSSNQGTGFGLPLIVMVTILAAAGLPHHPLIASLAVVILLAGVGAEGFGRTSEWWLGPPYRTMAMDATQTTHVPNLDLLEQHVLASTAGGITVLARDDDVLNANGLSWFANRKGLRFYTLIVPPYGPHTEDVVRQDLLDAQFLITGTTPAPYHASLSQDLVRAIAAREGFVRFRSWRVSGQNTIEVWRHAG